MERIGRKIKSGFVQLASFKIMVDSSYALHTNKVKNYTPTSCAGTRRKRAPVLTALVSRGQRMFNPFKKKQIEWPFDQPKNCAVFTIRQVIDRESPIQIVYHDLEDDGWQFVSNI